MFPSNFKWCGIIHKVLSPIRIEFFQPEPPEGVITSISDTIDSTCCLQGIVDVKSMLSEENKKDYMKMNLKQLQRQMTRTASKHMTGQLQKIISISIKI